MDGLADLFRGAFLFGLIFSLASLLVGAHFGHGSDAGHALDGGHGMHAGHDVAVEHGGPAGHAVSAEQQHPTAVSPWNLTAMTAFVAWFGGVGYLALTEWRLGVWLTLLLAVLGGFVGWAVVIWFYRRVLLRAEAPMDPAEYRLEGTLARATAPISAERTGEVQFTRGGALRSESARSADAATIAPGTEVVIVRYERGLAYVEPWEAYAERAAPEGRQGGS